MKEIDGVDFRLVGDRLRQVGQPDQQQKNEGY
jgi:hypothetical protein